MVLCFDVGNTDIDAGAFENDKLYKAFNIDYKKGQSVEEYKKGIKNALEVNGIDPKTVTSCVLCSVVAGSTGAMEEAIKELLGFEPLIFTNDEIANMQVKIGNPQEVGVDIVAACLAVKHRYSLPAIVIDMGTATTVTAMDKDGDLLGVSILTGVITSLKALRDSTGLPIDESLTPPAKAIGTTTPESMASGCVLANAYMMDGMISAFEKEMGTECHIYATGGISKMIMPLCRHKSLINDKLLLEGLYIYCKKAENKNNKEI